VKRWLQKKIASVARCLQEQAIADTVHDLERRGLYIAGRHTYGYPTIHSYQGSESKVTIGSFCSIAPGVQIINGGIHPKSWVSLYPFRIKWMLDGAFRDGMPESRGDITIGSDVWLGTDALVLSGAVIGHGAIVSARSVVTCNIEPYAIVAGCPAKPITHRFPPDVIERLLRISWWEWDDDAIREAIPLLSSPNIDEFLRVYGSVRKE
jgi:acetyltransferase-like isoleucine patch superfamily enzyme